MIGICLIAVALGALAEGLYSGKPGAFALFFACVVAITLVL